MENRAISTKKTIEDKEYQFTKTDPRTACWLFSFLGSRAADGNILGALGKCTRSEFDEIQTIVFRNVFYLDNKDGAGTFPIAIIAPNGEFTDKNLLTRADLVFKLMSESLLFNLSPFLEERGSNSVP